MNVWVSNGYIKVRISPPAVLHAVANVGMGLHVSVHTLVQP